MNYPLKDLAQFTEYEGEQVGLLINCPNCGVAGGVMFAGTKYKEKYSGATWQKTGSTLDDISLTPSVLMYDHFHSWVRDGQLMVDSVFSCQRKAE